MRLNGRAAIIAIALLLFAPGHAQEQEQEQEQASEILVTGVRDRERQVREFVTALTPAPSGSIPRFIDQVCPLVVGLVPAQNEAVADRLREVARAAGLPVARSGCAPNAFVIATRDKKEFIEALARRQPGSFGRLTAAQIRRLARSPGPAAAWHLEGLVDADGTPLYWDDAYNSYRNDVAGSASRLRTMSRHAFDASALVVEVGALDGLTPLQLADYAAMRLFAKLDPARLPDSPPPTILTVLTAPMGSPVPITMTAWDLGFLRGFYEAQPDLIPGLQRSEVRRRVIRELDASAAEPRN